MKILILNWRDIKNPTSGGAEILTHEMAKRWIKWGHEVTQFSSLFKGAKEEEIIDGVKFVRKGKSDARFLFKSVHFMAYWYYNKYFKGKFDVIIDEVHGVPFFTPLYVKERKIVLICEVAGKIWDINFPYPFNVLGKNIEKSYFKFYKNIDFLTISSSTKKDLQKFGVNPASITILPMGINVPKNVPKYEKEKNSTLIFIGRLTKAKGIEDAIVSCKILLKNFPDIKLWVVGRGEKAYEEKIKKLICNLKLENHVVLWGFVSEAKKFELIQRSHVLISTSIKEGFGLTIPEAGIVGTPCVAYDVGGFRDVVKNNKNGILVDCNPKALAEKVSELITKKDLYEKLQKEAIISAKRLNWNNTARVALSAISSLK